jgi:hypothetical protein
VSRIWSDEQLARYQGWLDNAHRARATLSELKALAISGSSLDRVDFG